MFKHDSGFTPPIVINRQLETNLKPGHDGYHRVLSFVTGALAAQQVVPGSSTIVYLSSLFVVLSHMIF